MVFCVKTLHGVSPLHFFASLLFISSVLNTWTGTEGWSYHHSDVTMNWENARKWCREHFTDMVAIQNKEEISHLNSVLPKVTGYYWIGIRKIDDIWTWVGTNKILTDEAKNWAGNEPNGKKKNEDCVEIYIKRNPDAGKWNDESCSKLKTALCYTASCKEDSCVSGHGQCVEMINNHTCSCFEGFYGDRCENVIKCRSEDVTTPDYGSVQCSNPNGKFSYDSQCEYSCEAGFKLQGSRMMRCTATTEWSSKPPSCELVQCSELIKPNNGTMDCHHDSKGNFSHQTTCEFACQEGYTLGTSSSTTLFCKATGHWNDSQPSCEITKCKPEDITAPGHGSVRCSNPNGNFAFDSVCEYTCEEGYELKGSVTTRCDATTEWTNKPPTCEPVQCSELIKPNNGTMDCHHDSKGNYSYKSTCEFACQEGYTLGTSSSTTLFCGATGHWNDSQPSCKVVKCNPDDITTLYHGSVMCYNPNGNLSYDSVCEYSCVEGYELKGSITTRCTATTEWTNKPPTCEPVRCPVLENPANGLLACNDFSRFSYGNKCSFSCEEGYRLQGASEISCTKTAEWSHEPPGCEAVECPQLHEPVNGHMNCTSLEPAFGTICIFSCHDGFQLHSNEMVMCNHNGNWSGEVALCQVQPGPSVPAFKAVEVTLGVAATVGSSSLLLVLCILRKLRKNANKFDLSSKSDIGDPPQVYKNSIDSLI
ncbi:E-selectin [Triplophysa rosa]|uniref:E-selectin n=1 Tax=Triplophysa rosa TaxID=992332 RepID=A0A9W7TNZ4_TRIRA|nr:E-selectin [Triplophysa rosa]KAI7799522.1 hypothetical protein IRJ41_005067 [Triplophysa rosa]